MNKERVEILIREYQQLVEHAQDIAKIVDEVRHGSAAGDYYHIELPEPGESLVSASYYYRQNEWYINFPIDYLWQDSLEIIRELEVARFNQEKEAQQAKQQQEKAEELRRKEQSEREQYERLKAKYAIGDTVT